jgi:transketolase
MDRFGASAPQEDLYEAFGFTSENVAARARAVIERLGART